MNKENRVEFEKPNLPELTGKFTVVDLHYHTRYSDGASMVGPIAKKARELGIGDRLYKIIKTEFSEYL